MSFNKKRNRRESKTAESELSNGGKQKTLHHYSSIMLGTVGGSYTWCSSWKVCNTATICLYISIFSTYIVILFSNVAFPRTRMTSIYSNMYNHKCMVQHQFACFVHLYHFLCGNMYFTKPYTVVIYNYAQFNIHASLCAYLLFISFFFLSMPSLHS